MGTVFSSVAVSIDGFLSGVGQSLERPFGHVNPGDLHEWHMSGIEENREEADGIVAAGAFVMGRNMFGPIRGEWGLEWEGWWGDNPPYHGPVYVLTHYPREPLVMEGGTTFYFVTDGAESALAQAKAAAGDADVSIAGGAETIREYLSLGAIDELRLHIVPFLVGKGERIFDGLEGPKLTQVSSRGASAVTHITYRVEY